MAILKEFFRGDEDPLDDAVLAAFFASVGDDDGAGDVLMTGSSSRDWILLFDGDTWTDDKGKGKGKGKK